MGEMAVVALGLDRMEEAALLRRAAYQHALPDFPMLHTAAEDIAFWRMRHEQGAQIVGILVEDRLGGVMMSSQGWIDQLYVGVHAQRQGLGRCLLDHAKARMTVIDLWTFQQNERARRFYEANGFVVVEETDGAGNEERQPDIRYRWSRR